MDTTGLFSNRTFKKHCTDCKYFTMHFHTLEPESQRCKKYNKPTKMATDATNCKGFKEREFGKRK